MNGCTPEGWGQLFLADAGASAALAGLLSVAVSINLDSWIRAMRAPVPNQPRFIPSYRWR